MAPRPSIMLTLSVRNKTLNGGRAERNEYILLHEFHRLKYICPDKQWGKKVAQVKVEQEEDGEVGEAKTSKGKRDKYKGGLVFEPKRGLWDRFILVMDFNSLYPSIIQEYNIDFTTVDRQDSDVSRSFSVKFLFAECRLLGRQDSRATRVRDPPRRAPSSHRHSR